VFPPVVDDADCAVATAAGSPRPVVVSTAITRKRTPGDGRERAVVSRSVYCWDGRATRRFPRRNETQRGRSVGKKKKRERNRSTDRSWSGPPTRPCSLAVLPSRPLQSIRNGSTSGRERRRRRWWRTDVTCPPVCSAKRMLPGNVFVHGFTVQP